MELLLTVVLSLLSASGGALTVLRLWRIDQYENRRELEAIADRLTVLERRGVFQLQMLGNVCKQLGLQERYSDELYRILQLDQTNKGKLS